MVEFEAFLLDNIAYKSQLWIHSKIKACMNAVDCLAVRAFVIFIVELQDFDMIDTLYRRSRKRGSCLKRAQSYSVTSMWVIRLIFTVQLVLSLLVSSLKVLFFLNSDVLLC